MAKTIKFNLICDGYPVRTIDDLRNNFSIEDIITYYENGVLQRWLLTRGYKFELEQVNNIRSTGDIEVIKELITIFNVESDPVSVEKDTYFLQFRKENKTMLDLYKDMNFKVTSIVEDYFSDYVKLISWIIENKDDIAVVKAAIGHINERFADIYEYDYRNLFYTFLKHAPIAIFIMLTHDRMRSKYLIQNEDDFDESFVIRDDRKIIYEEISKLCYGNQTLPSLLGDNLKSFSGNTEAYWKDVETKDKKYMILYMQSGNFVRAAGVSGGDLSSTDINGKFMILDGIDYKSNNSVHTLLYMEV